jgi:hypothetical protein
MTQPLPPGAITDAVHALRAEQDAGPATPADHARDSARQRSELETVLAARLRNIHGMQHDRSAAQQIIKALALPALSRASKPPRPMPLSHLPRLPRETSMLYAIGRIDRSGRVTNRGITDALRWQPGDRLAMTLTPSAVVFSPAPDGLLRVPPRPCIAIPVTARRLLSITPGDELLLAAAPEHRIVITHTMQAVEDMLTSFYAQIAADELPQP